MTHPIGRSFDGACVEVECRPHADQNCASASSHIVRHPELLLGASQTDPNEVRLGAAYVLTSEFYFFGRHSAEGRRTCADYLHSGESRFKIPRKLLDNVWCAAVEIVLPTKIHSMSAGGSQQVGAAHARNFRVSEKLGCPDDRHTVRRYYICSFMYIVKVSIAPGPYYAMHVPTHDIAFRLLANPILQH